MKVKVTVKVLVAYRNNFCRINCIEDLSIKMFSEMHECPKQLQNYLLT